MPDILYPSPKWAKCTCKTTTTIANIHKLTTESWIYSIKAKMQFVVVLLWVCLVLFLLLVYRRRFLLILLITCALSPAVIVRSYIIWFHFLSYISSPHTKYDMQKLEKWFHTDYASHSFVSVSWQIEFILLNCITSHLQKAIQR